MALIINTHYKQKLTSSTINDKVNLLVGKNGIIDGFQVTKNNNNIIISAGKMIIKGVSIENNANITIPIPQDLINADNKYVIAEYSPESESVQFTVVASNEKTDYRIVLCTIQGSAIIQHSKDNLIETLSKVASDIKAMKDNLLDEQYLSYEGEHVTCGESVVGETNSLKIIGNTMQNFITNSNNASETVSVKHKAEGVNHKIEPSYDGIVSDISVEGNTHQNLIKNPTSREITLPLEFHGENNRLTITDSIVSKVEIKELKGVVTRNVWSESKCSLEYWRKTKTLPGGLALLKTSTVYTAIPINMPPECTSLRMDIYVKGAGYMYAHLFVNASATSPFVFTTQNSWQRGDAFYSDMILYLNGDNISEEAFGAAKLLILEGDWRDAGISEYFEGVQGVGKLNSSGTYDITIKSRNISRSIWDGVFPYAKTRLDYVTGEFISDGGFRTTEYIPVKANTSYHHVGYRSDVCFFDENKNVIGRTSGNVPAFTTPDNCCFIRFSSYSVPERPVGFGLVEGADTTNGYQQEHTKTITLPCQLNKVGNICDKFYYDQPRGKWCIEKNTAKTTLPIIPSFTNENANYYVMTCYGEQFKKWRDAFPGIERLEAKIHAGHTLIDIPGVMTLSDYENAWLDITKNKGKYFSCYNPNAGTNDAYAVLRFRNTDCIKATQFNGWVQSFSEEVAYYRLATPEIIETEYTDPDLLMLNTYANTTNIHVESIVPATMFIDQQGYEKEVVISADKEYFISCATSKEISVDLGGTIVAYLPSEKFKSVRTPNTLTHNNVIFKGAGAILKNVMVTPKQYSGEYFEGIVGVGRESKNLITSYKENVYLGRLWNGSIQDEYVSDLVCTDSSVTFTVTGSSIRGVTFKNIKASKPGKYVIQFKFKNNKEGHQYFYNFNFMKKGKFVKQVGANNAASKIGDINYAIADSGQIDFDEIYLTIGTLTGACTITVTDLCLHYEDFLYPKEDYYPGNKLVLSSKGINLFNEKKEAISGLEVRDIDGVNAYVMKGSYLPINNNTFAESLTLKENTQYTFSMVCKKGRHFNQLYFHYADGTRSCGATKGTTEWETYTLTSQANKTIVAISNDTGGGASESYIKVGSIQLVEGTVAKPFTAYKEDKKEVRLLDQLHSLPNGIKDEVKDGYVIRRIRKTVLNNSYDAYTHNLEKHEEYYIAKFVAIAEHLGKPVVPGISSNVWKQADLITDSFIFKDYRAYTDRQLGEWMCVYSSFVCLSIHKSRLASSEYTDFKRWLSENPITMYYELQTPQINPIIDGVEIADDSRKPNFNCKLKTYSEVTNIECDSFIKPNVKINSVGASREVLLKPNTEYTVQLEPSSGSGNLTLDLGGTEKEISRSSQITKITTPATLKHSKLYIAGWGVNVQNLSVSDKVIPYVEGLSGAGHNEIDSATQQNVINLGSCNVNLFDYSEYKKQFPSCTITGDVISHKGDLKGGNHNYSFMSPMKVALEPNTTYTFCVFNLPDSGQQLNCEGMLYDTSSALGMSIPPNSVRYKVFRTNDSNYKHGVSFKFNTGTNGDPAKYQIMICKGDVRPDKYVHRSADKQKILLSGSLHALPNGVKDTIESINGVFSVVRRCKEIIADGSNTAYPLKTAEHQNTESKYGYDIVLPYNVSNPISDKLINLSDRLQDMTLWIHGGVGNIVVIRVDKDKVKAHTVEALKDYLSQNPIKILCQLETPEITPLNIPSLKVGTFGETTHVFSENAVRPMLSVEIPTTMGATIKSNYERVQRIEDMIDKVLLPELVEADYRKSLLEFDYSMTKMIK